MGDIADLTAKTYDIARLIPPGRVTSYGHIAKLAGYPTYSRHRVVNSKGIISPRGDFGLGVARQKERLEDEGVEVETLTGAGGERVDLRRWGWFPETLPQDGEE
ncbi:methylated-DNA-protein-cysteine methyltransferase, variant [Cryptococcus neoformans var. grubii H99]|uniref:Methylated-DNA-protein-cysteine methyltransferase, variant n=1 Tax=Cryptococcus neoformans (strain H99 / ATCC 208821 / CBS 10515 / FGSC 9487) TaxID=235443 RepID=T2BMM5_CRYN9|nr:methylated-DNA-protein-cysteine methyltransferase, variant [Cryptococcus neoformans var. grubii H99]AGV14440.1 methylated-DNA-protein-cysteine methyltransferase, variant [Cryptococcus neoformans var. grubii H99]AUB25551.1 methylated-DNA-protein-cysteine methyltransferase [Cryptococcus neoformans var. grubii]|eukprot:XP_012049948.1 methylated-DNA-protein-cysteine methyltransferase, variant [Cryptococcus neoformans var. grubii H99]